MKMEIEGPKKVLRLNSEEMSIKVKIGEKVFQLTKCHYQQMPYFQESMVLSSGKKVQESSAVVYQENYIPQDQFSIIMDIIYQFMSEDSNVPAPTKVKSSNPKDSLGQLMTHILDQLTGCQFNKGAISRLKKLYHYSHYVQLNNLCHSIAAYLASRVYFKDVTELQQLKKYYNIEGELTFHELSKLKEQFSFLNLTD